MGGGGLVSGMGGGVECGICLFIQNLFWDNLHLQIIASISPKASVENSSAQWAIFFLFLFINAIIKSFC